MKANNRHHKFIKHGIMVLALLLSLGVLGFSWTPPAYGTTAQYTTVTTLATPVAKAVSASYTSIKVSWAAVPNATSYKVYRYSSAIGTYEYLGTTTNLSYTNGSLITGKTYYYKVVAYMTVNGTTVKSNASVGVYTKPIPATPTSSVIPKTATSAKIYWNQVLGATKYLVYRATTEAGDYSLVNTASSTARSYTDTGLTNGKTYYYKVKAYHLEGTTKVYGYSSSAKSVKVGSVYYSGTYKVGTDIPAGEYLLIATSVEDAMFYTSTDAAGMDFLVIKFGKTNIYETLRIGEYITIDAMKAYPIASAPKVAVKADGTFLPGQYKVGRDILAGTYVVDSHSTTSRGHMLIESNSYNESDSITGVDAYRGRIYVTLESGDYFTFDTGIGYLPSKEPALDKTQPNLNDGMYLVGTDIPAGTYTIVSKDMTWGYYKIYADATHSEGSTLDFALLNTDKVVTVKNGQYLFVFEGYFAQKVE